jgi:phage/plasmid-associated DNA primase
VARRVATAEVEDGRHLTDSLVKQLIGRDCAKARYRRQDVFKFDIEAKFWIVSNHKPFIHGTIARSGGIYGSSPSQWLFPNTNVSERRGRRFAPR